MGENYISPNFVVHYLHHTETKKITYKELYITKAWSRTTGSLFSALLETPVKWPRFRQVVNRIRTNKVTCFKKKNGVGNNSILEIDQF